MTNVKRSPTKSNLRGRNVDKVSTEDIDDFRAAMVKSGVADVVSLSAENALCRVKRYVSTQSIALDKAIGHPGIPCGKITEISGPPGAGKSTLTDHILAQTQREGGIAVLIDAEEARDFTYSQLIGVDVDSLAKIEPKQRTLEGALQALESAIDYWKDKSKDRLLTVVLDSVAALPPRHELEESYEKIQPGAAAKLLRIAMRRLVGKIAEHEVALILVNQQYTKIGQSFGDSFASYGGDAIPYHSTLRIRLTKGRRIDGKDGEVLGHVANVNIIKSKLFGTQPRTEIAVLKGIGIDNIFCIHERFQQERFIQAGGAGWYSMQLEGMLEPLKWRGGFQGLNELCNSDPTLFARLVAVFQALP